MNLNPKHKAFADNLLKDPKRNRRRAYKKVYGKNIKDAVADAAASRLLRNVKVQQYIESVEKEVTDDVQVTNVRIIQEYAKIAFLDPRKLFDEDGSLKNIHKIEDDTAAVIAGLDCENLFEGKGKDREFVGTLKKIKLVDKKGALDSLSRIRGMFQDKVEVTNKTFEDFLAKARGQKV